MAKPIRIRTSRASASPQAVIDTRSQSRAEQAQYFSAGGPTALATIAEPGVEPEDPKVSSRRESMAFLEKLADHGGNLMDILPQSIVQAIEQRTFLEYQVDVGSREGWLEMARRGLQLAEQEHDADENQPKGFPFENASDVHYPILTTAALQFQSRAMSSLVSGDQVAKVKTFAPPAPSPSADDLQKKLKEQTDAVQAASMGHNGGPPMQAPDQLPPQLRALQAEVAKAKAREEAMSDAANAKEARAKRVKAFLNWTIFYKMDDWKGETDVLLMEMPIIGIGFKKVMMTSSGLCSDYVAATRLVVHNKTKSLRRCPRISQVFSIYPYEIEQGQAEGKYCDIRLANMDSSDPEAEREWIEQHRMEDLDGDGVAEPYIITLDLQDRKMMRMEAAFTRDDIIVDPTDDNRVIRIERYVPFPTYVFLPSPRGNFYAMGLAKLLDAITDSVDTTINQLIDAGTAQIAGGGFIGGQVRFQGQGQGGNLYFQPGEFKTVGMSGADIRAAIWERTVPQPSDVSFKMLELLLAAAKDIASVKDVVTGDTPATAPVGTTMALQDQALTVFNAIYGRIWDGFREEFQLMYRCVKRYATPEMKREYFEITGGDLAADFAGDGTDIQPVADPKAVTKMQKIARLQTIMQLAESPIGIAAGMTQPGPAQEIIREALEALDVDRPERFLAEVGPNPLEVAKTADLQAKTKLALSEVTRAQDQGNLDNAKATRETVLTAMDAHKLHQEAARIRTSGDIQPPPEGNQDGTSGQGAPQGASPGPPPILG